MSVKDAIDNFVNDNYMDSKEDLGEFFKEKMNDYLHNEIGLKGNINTDRE